MATRFAMAVLTIGLSMAALAQTGGGFNLIWNTIDGGGITFSTGGGFRLGATIGQPDANTTPMTGGGYKLRGGFWPGAKTVPFLGTVRLQMWDGSGVPINTLPCTVTVDANPDQVPPLVGSGDTASFTVLVSPSDSHSIRAKPQGFLAQRLTVTTSVGSANFFGPDSSSGLIPGDTDDSNGVDDADIIDVILDFGQPGGTSSGYPGTDSDGSGIVDDNEIIIIILFFGQVGDN